LNSPASTIRSRCCRRSARTCAPGQRVFVGVIDPIDPEVETREQVQERVLLAARYIPLDQFGTTDDCGFSPFADDRSTARETAFAKIRARVEGTRLAAEQLGV
jgi:5-methyltetrahydropteroyltriglutamate--homocysteine methyltransferase